jgi:hypothetical protein
VGTASANDSSVDGTENRRSVTAKFLTFYVSPGNVKNKTLEAIFANGFESGSEGGEPPAHCDSPFMDRASPIYTDWAHALGARDGSPLAVYPRGLSYPVAVGTSKFTALVIPFTPLAGQTVNFYFDQVQARPSDGYGRARPADLMWVAITECADEFGRGRVDLRPAVQGAVDPFQRPGCRKVENSASLIWTTAAFLPESNDAACKLIAGRTYFLIVSPVNPQDGIAEGEHTCSDVPSSASGCDVGVFSTSD